MDNFDFRKIAVCCCIAVINIQLYTYTCGNIINYNDERTHFYRKIYLSHFILERVAKRLCVRGELETEQTATYWPQIPLSLATLLSRSTGLLNRRSWGPSPLWELVLTTASYLQLTEPVCGTELYNCLISTCFLRTSHLHPIQPVHSQCFTLISSTGCACYLHRCISYLTARPRVNILHYNLSEKDLKPLLQNIVKSCLIKRVAIIYDFIKFIWIVRKFFN